MNNENNKETMICLQRIINTDEQGNPQDIIKTNYKCIDNDLNKWYVKQNNDDEKIYSIISLYDNKCLNYSGDILYVENVKKIIYMKNSLLKIILYIRNLIQQNALIILIFTLRLLNLNHMKI